MTTQTKPVKAVLSGADVVALGEFVPGDAVPPESGGTGLDALGAANQVLGVNAAGTAMENKAIVGGAGMAVSHTPNAITLTATSINQDGNNLINYYLGAR
jgi:hypothetical protein